MGIVDGLLPIGEVPRRLRNQFMRGRFGQRLMAPFGRELKPERWIFIVGCYNSGTTLLKDMLAGHPAIGVLPGEGVKFTDALPRPEEFGWNRMWCRCLDDVRLQPGVEMEGRVERIKRQWSIVYPKDRRNLLEKSIPNAARMPFLQVHFSPAYFIYLMRDGYAAAEGIRRKARPWLWKNSAYSSAYPIELCAEQWAETDRVIGEDRGEIEHFLQVSYEELAAKPVEVMGRITDFLGLPPLADEMMGQRWKVHGVESPIRNMNEESFAQLSAEDVDAIEEAAGPALVRYGYGRPDLESGGE